MEGPSFEQSVEWAIGVLQEAACLDARRSVTSVDPSTGRLVSLSVDDWTRLRGLQLCAQFGPCTNPVPEWSNSRARQQWAAWQSQGVLDAAEAKAKFCAAVRELPGQVVHGPSEQVASSPFGCLQACLPQVPSDSSAQASMPALPDSMDASASAAERATLESFTGTWRPVKTLGLSEYLSHLGVPPLERSLAAAFNPNPSITVVRGHLRMVRSPHAPAQSTPGTQDHRMMTHSRRSACRRWHRPWAGAWSGST